MISYNNLLHRLFSLTLALFLGLSAGYAQNPAPGTPQTKPIALVGGTIHPVTGAPIQNGIIVFDKGIITAIGGSNLSFDRSSTEIIDVSGKHIYPGTIAASSTVGLQEIESVRATLDYREVGDMNPHARALIAYNTDSEIIPTLRSSGILIAQATPQGGLLSGTSSVFHTDGWNWEDAVLKKDDGVWLNWPSYISQSFDRTDFSTSLKKNEARQQSLNELQQFFADAKAYHELTNPTPVNLRLNAMKPLFEGKANLYIHANLAKDIVEAVQFARKFGIQKIVVAGATEADKVAEFLKDNNVAVLLNELHRLPSHQDEYVYQPYSLPGKLVEAGVLTGLTYGAEWWRVRNLNYQAGTASAFARRLEAEEALKLVTLNPAKILGIDQYVGSLEVGKHATLVVTTGDILDMKTNIVEQAFIKGSRVNLDDKQKRLFEKYKEKYGHN